jgi:hypothetical protein
LISIREMIEVPWSYLPKYRIFFELVRRFEKSHVLSTI